MKTLFYTKTLIALAVAVAAAAANVSQAQEQPIPPPSADSALPANIQPGTPLGDVVKMFQAGVDGSTIQSYIANTQSPFNLDADKIIYLKDIGVPSEVVNAMMDRDKVLYASTVAPPPAPAPVPVTTPDVADTAPPPTEVTVNYFYSSLSPYGSWVDVDGYGRCWRPTVAVYNAGWRPYCDSGHWVYTDCGWYWDSDYSWGVAFHYGRWFQDVRLGWVWYPDTVWAPSWVTWRSGGDYCGWAPLPPFAVFTPGVGFFYRGASVAVGFDFGLDANCFVFCGADHFCDRRPRSFCFDRPRVQQIFQQTTIINNYSVVNNDRHTVINHGIDPGRISRVTHHEIQPIQVSALPNAGRQGWRGENNRSFTHGSANNNAGGNVGRGNGQLVHGAAADSHNNWNNTGGAIKNPNQGSRGIVQDSKPMPAIHAASPSDLVRNNNGANNNNVNAYSQQHTKPLVTGGERAQGSQYNYNWRNSSAENSKPQFNSQPQINLRKEPPVQSQQVQVHSYTPPVVGTQQHGSSQLEQHSYNVQNQPHFEPRPEPAPRNSSYNPPPSPPPSQGQPHNSNTGGNNGNGSGGGSNQNKNR